MSTRPMPPRSAASQANPDLDSTAELPVLDPPATAATETPTATVEIAKPPADDRHAGTDSWPLAPPARTALAVAAARADGRRRHEAELQSRAKELRETQERLAAHGKRLLQLEHARDEALAAQAAAAQRAAGSEQRASAAEQRATAAEQRAAAAVERITELEQRSAQLSAELAQRQATAAQQATRLEQSARALTAAEQRAAAAEGELAQARTSVSAARTHTQALQQRLEQQQSDSQTQHAREVAEQQTLAAERRAHAAAVMEDLHHERARAMSYLESLQALERRREIAQELVGDLQREVDARAADLRRVTRELTQRDELAHTQDGELAQRNARIAQLEQQLGTLTTTLAQRSAQLQDGEQEAQGLRASVARLQGEINAGAERRRALEAQVAQHDSSEGQQAGELQRLRNELASSNAAASAQANTQQAAFTEQTERCGRLEASLDAERQRAGQLESELAAVRAEMEEWGGVLRSVQQERGGHLATIAAGESRVRELERQAVARDENVRALQAECATHLARVRELESDVHAAEEALHRLEAEVRNRDAQISELETTNQQWRETPGEMRLAATDSTPILNDPTVDPEEQEPIVEPVAAGAGRLLIRSEGGREVVHVLGRKTSIGRTPDNDLQLDAKFVSRHHAVILVGPNNTVIEDLNSTNGVQVNGRRVTRQTLRDGDRIAIGRTQYHFLVRKSADKR